MPAAQRITLLGDGGVFFGMAVRGQYGDAGPTVKRTMLRADVLPNAD